MLIESLSSTLTDEQAEALQASHTDVALHPGEYLFKQGQSAEGAYCVNHGSIGIQQYTRSGESRTLYVASQGDFLGLLDAVRDMEHSGSAVSLTDAMVCFIPKSVLKRLIDENPALLLNIMQIICRQVSNVERRAGETMDV